MINFLGKMYTIIIASNLSQLLTFSGNVPHRIITLISNSGDVTMASSYTKKLIHLAPYVLILAAL